MILIQSLDRKTFKKIGTQTQFSRKWREKGHKKDLQKKLPTIIHAQP